jgi:hypothetical protein
MKKMEIGVCIEIDSEGGVWFPTHPSAFWRRSTKEIGRRSLNQHGKLALNNRFKIVNSNEGVHWFEIWVIKARNEQFVIRS